MARASYTAQTAGRVRLGGWGRADTVLLTLATVMLALVAAQFALAGLGAFTMVKTPADNAYGAHMVLGVVIGVLEWLTAAAVLTQPGCARSSADGRAGRGAGAACDPDRAVAG
jgi:hypothetical protein